MKLTIITGPQGSGKTTYLNNTANGITSLLYSTERLERCPLHLPGLHKSINLIQFDEVNQLSYFYMLGAIAANNYVHFQTHKPGVTEARNNIEIMIATLTTRKEIAHIFKGLPNVTFIELKHIYTHTSEICKDPTIHEKEKKNVRQPYEKNVSRKSVLMETTNGERKEFTKQEKRSIDKGLKEAKQIEQGEIKGVEFEEFLETLDNKKIVDYNREWKEHD